MDIKIALDQFILGKGKNKGRKPDERYASFDYCYNHFYNFYKEKRISELANEKKIQSSVRHAKVHTGTYQRKRRKNRGVSI